MCEYLKNNLNWIIPLLITVIFSIISTILTSQNIKIMNQQGKLQNDSFCFQLYDRRLNVFTEIKTIITRIITDDAVLPADLSDLLKTSREVEFLFGKEVSDTCKDLYDTINKLRVTKIKIESENKKGQKISDLLGKESALMGNLSECNIIFSEQIKKYISFEDYKTVEEKQFLCIFKKLRCKSGIMQK